MSVATSQPAEGAQRQRLADFTAAGAEAVWTPRIGVYDHLVLTIGGPDGYTAFETFPFGQSPTLGLYDADGNALVDGQYKFELILVPYLDETSRARLEAARAQGEAAIAQLRREGVLPRESSRQTGYFTIAGGSFVPSNLVESAAAASKGGVDRASVPGPPQGVVLTNADGVIRNSLCVGLDCPDSPAFDDSTILMMENNTRIKFGDTSNSPFPNNDWEIEANSSSSGGAGYLGFNDCGTADNDGGCATDLVFAVEAGARASALYVEADGDVGLGTSSPVLDLHIVTGNTPALRLDQDGSSGFTAQVWDIAGNESGFFIRDATGGSQLPFRIRPGAPSSSIDIGGTGNVGIGTTGPVAPLHVRRTNKTAKIVVEDTTTTAGNQVVHELIKPTSAPITRYTSQFRQWDFTGGNLFTINDPSDAAIEMTLSAAGTLTLEGSLITGGAGTCAPPNPACDGVFESGYPLESIDDHAGYMWANQHLPAVGATPAHQPIDLTLKTQGILNELEKAHIYIEQLHRRIERLEQRLAGAAGEQ